MLAANRKSRRDLLVVKLICSVKCSQSRERDGPWPTDSGVPEHEREPDSVEVGTVRRRKAIASASHGSLMGCVVDAGWLGAVKWWTLHDSWWRKMSSSDIVECRHGERFSVISLLLYSCSVAEERR